MGEATGCASHLWNRSLNLQVWLCRQTPHPNQRTFSILLCILNPHPTPEEDNREKLLHNLKKVHIIIVTDLRPSLEIEIGYGETNACLEWIKYSVCSLNKSNCYTCIASRLETQVVSFLQGWSSDPNGVVCMISLYQEDSIRENESCKTSLLKKSKSKKLKQCYLP